MAKKAKKWVHFSDSGKILAKTWRESGIPSGHWAAFLSKETQKLLRTWNGKTEEVWFREGEIRCSILHSKDSELRFRPAPGYRFPEGIGVLRKSLRVHEKLVPGSAMTGKESIQDPIAANLILAIGELKENDDPILVDRLAAALRYRVYSALVSDFDRIYRRSVAQAVQYIQENIEKRLTIAEIADAAGLSPFHFCRVFRSETGMTPSTFIHKKRVELAKILLASNPDTSLADAAITCGFANQSHMTRVFTKLTGVTPLQYRKEKTG